MLSIGTLIGKLIDKIFKKPMLITSEQLRQIEPRLTPTRAKEMADLLNEICPKYGINTIDIFEEFLANVMQESGYFSHKVENMNYSAERIVQVWPSRFKTISEAKPYARNPQLLANKVYGGRMGNNTQNDGWIFRGGGFIGLTGREVYTLYSKYINQPLEQTAELVRTTDRYALDSACWFFAKLKGLIDEAENDEFKKIVKSINGGYIGLADRQRYYDKVKQVLNNNTR